MQTQFEYIQQLAGQYHTFAEDSAPLYPYLEQLDQAILKNFEEKYADPARGFQPINLLRLECIQNLLRGKTLNDEVVEAIKQRIRQKNESYFGHLGPKMLQALQEYPLGKRDWFANWRKAWNIFFPLVYPEHIRQSARSTLVEIATQLLKDLDLPDYTFHLVDFSGPLHLGSDTASLSLYPADRGGHQHTYQLFVKISAVSGAGIATGSKLGKTASSEDQLLSIGTYAEALRVLEKMKPKVLALNEKLPAYDRILPSPPDYKNPIAYGQPEAKRNLAVQEPPVALFIPRYRYEDDPERPFVATETFVRLVHLLKRKRNVILQGPPGVGKTFLASKLAYGLMGYKHQEQIQRLQFHQSYSYEDFVQGLRPAPSGGFELRNGVFYQYCQLAHAHPDQAYFLIIDEINRGNLSKIFGELLQLIEADKRAENYAVRLTYGSENDPAFFVPPNLYLIGTMNTADRSLAIIDYALRRRFAFVEVEPCFDETFTDYLQQQGLSSGLVQHIATQVQKLNEEIVRDPNLGKDFRLGHSYFCTYIPAMDEGQWYQDVLRYEIRPMLEEMWFDQPERVEKAFQNLEKYRP